MEEFPHLKLSVHQLVDFLLRSGDIDDRVYNQDTMTMGSQIHSSFQKRQSGDYISEYFLGENFEEELGSIFIEGRADGIIPGETPIIEEIKSTVDELTHFHQEQEAWHLGQAECYALMYAHEKELKQMAIRLTYISQTNGQIEKYDYLYSLEQLEKKVHGYIHDYLLAYQQDYRHIQLRNESVKALAFPYSKFRKGQRELAKYVYGLSQKGGELFVEAPTGIGKTISTLYPSIKSFASSDNEKIFYLTAKSTGRIAAYEALGELYKKGLVIHDSSLVAKDKLCLNRGAGCNPDECPYAKGYYNKIKKVEQEAVSSYRRFDADYVLELAKQYEICPSELQLDLSNHSDVIIADYNYFFDPQAHLIRFFDETVDASHDLVLIDEAHNLISRGREMFGVSFSLSDIQFAKKELRPIKAVGLKRNLGNLGNFLIDHSSEEDGYRNLVEEEIIEVVSLVQKIKKNQQDLQKKNHHLKFSEGYLDLVLAFNKFIKIREGYYSSTSSLVYLEKKGKQIRFVLYCADPSRYLENSLQKVKGSVLFSATLSPISYYMDSLTDKQEQPSLLLPSPFPKENMLLMIAPLSIRYKDRESTYKLVAEYLKNYVSVKEGNYFIYFPSYEYLDAIKDELDFGEAEVYVQEKQMSEPERLDFLSHFPSSPKGTNIGLFIIGGAFSEGIDMVSDRLIGVAIVGIGLPQVSHENDIIRDHFDQEGGDGFAYAYLDPGMNKVMQAIGRLIRSETDVGTALLIDDRYLKNEYRDIFARRYPDYEVVLNPKEVKENLTIFYKKISK